MKVYGAGVYLHKKDHKTAARLAYKCFKGCVRWSEDFCWWWCVYYDHRRASLPTKRKQMPEEE